MAVGGAGLAPEHLVMDAAHARYGEMLPEKVRALIKKELDLIRACNYPTLLP